jgi:hypothetical protein
MRKMAVLAAVLLAGVAGSAAAQSIGEKSGANALVPGAFHRGLRYDRRGQRHV